MKLAAHIFLSSSKEKVFETLKDVEKYPLFMLSIENVKIIEKEKHSYLSEWKININETIIGWQQWNYCDDENFTINFRCVRGDLSHIEGIWLVSEAHGRTKLSISLESLWAGPLALRFSNEFINKKLKVIVKAMLWSFKKYLDYGIETAKSHQIVSELINFENRDKRKIVGYFDHLRVRYANAPFIVLPPGYGETKRDTLSTSYFLVKNGFNCIRYDATDHVGESDGEIVNVTLTKFKKDLLSAIDYVEERFGVKGVGVVATSLAKRAAIKAASEDTRIQLLIGIVGVVNLQYTLSAVYNEDIIGDIMKGRIKDVYDVLGFKVNKEFPISAIKDNFHDVETTIKDISKIKRPVVFLFAEKDFWVDLKDVKMILETASPQFHEMTVIPEAMHQLYENPKAAKIALRQIVVSSLKYLKHKEVKIDSILEPGVREIAVQNRVEKERFRLNELFTISRERTFWSEYLASFSMIYKVPDYRMYLSMLHGLLGVFKDGDRILDAGCGVGYFGAWLISRIIEENEKNFSTELKLYSRSKYYGIDLVDSALQVAIQEHRRIKTAFLASRKAEDKLSVFLPGEYRECDLNFDLPFEDNYFDAVSCSLVISYLKEPLLTLRELARVLKKGGRIVVSSLKPYADLSYVYRNFIAISKSEQDIMEARKLLSEAGKIKEKEGKGLYHFFSEKELRITLFASGLGNVKVYRSFADQANIATGVKK